MENWATQKEFLDLFAVHYKSGEKMPQELIDKIVASKNYLAAYATCGSSASHERHGMAHRYGTRHGQCGGVRTHGHRTGPDNALHQRYGHVACLLPHLRRRLCGRLLWLQMGRGTRSRRFSLFEEQGIFNRDVAGSFRENILSKGGSEHPMTLYVRFRGHKPETKALIDKILE